MNKEEIESLFKKYKVRIPKEKQGQSECHECKRHHKYSLTWTSFLYEYKENYYCFEHIVNILLQQENEQLKDKLSKIETLIINNNLIDIKDKITDNRTILGCRLSYADLSKDVSFIVRQDNEPTYEQLQKENEQLKDNWNELKEFMSYENISRLFDMGYDANDFINEIEGKIKELEEAGIGGK